MNQQKCIEDLANLERQYMELYGAITEYQKVFAWLQTQKWYQDNEHLVHSFTEQHKKDLMFVVKKRKLGKPALCTICRKATIIREFRPESAVCIECKAERKRIHARKRLANRKSI